MLAEQNSEVKELASLIADVECGKFHDCSSCPDKDYLNCQVYHCAKGLVAKGVHIIPSGYVVLSREELAQERARAVEYNKAVQGSITISKEEYDRLKGYELKHDIAERYYTRDLIESMWRE